VAPPPAALELEAVTRRYPGMTRPAVDAVSLKVRAGETVAVLGPSGCGKSTLLRVAAGLERPDGGRVLIAGRDVTAWPPERRGAGLVFQDYALFPHLDVVQNVMYGLVEARMPRSEAREKALATLAAVGLSHVSTRNVTELSGGERQRVALARSLAPSPPVLLLDEPLSNLDESLRDELREELARLFASLESAAVLVTHDQREALSLANRLAVMREGRVVREGSPREVYEEPGDAWTARFLGHRNLLSAQEAARLGLPCPTGALLLVPEAAITFAGSGRTTRVTSAIYEGRATRVTLDLNGVTLRLDSPRALREGETVPVGLDQSRLSVLEGEG
jgi:ABC-type Fe3+/spermidine/putrescine transport system ATPase subunit